MTDVASSRAAFAGDRRALLYLGVPAYLVIAGFELRDVLRSESTALGVAAVAGTVLFSALFLWLIVVPRPHNSDGIVLAINLVMLVLALALMRSSSVYLAAAAAMAGDSLRDRWATPIIVIAALGIAANGIRDGLNAVEVVTASGIAASFGLLTMGVRRLALTNADLLAAREEVARLAVVEERLRFARDLHDLLGHSLTVIRAKSELAARLVDSDVDRAAKEMGEVEQLAREALADVRETVVGHRRRRLAAELDTARGALEAAGITPHIEASPLELAPDVDDALAYVLREGVTNVIRHSGASACRVQAACVNGSVQLVVADDGQGATGGEGSGLVGARERLIGVGGTLVAGAGADGFELVASVPRHG